MSMLSHLHQLFNPDTCHTSSHTLRWKDRPLQGPRCHSHDVEPWGTDPYRPGCKRSWCNGGTRTFNDLTNTLLHPSQRSLPPWLLTTFLRCLACSSQRIAREVGGPLRGSSPWGPGAPDRRPLFPQPPPPGGHGGSGCPLPSRRPAGATPGGWAAVVGAPATGAPHATRARPWP